MEISADDTLKNLKALKEAPQDTDLQQKVVQGIKAHPEVLLFTPDGNSSNMLVKDLFDCDKQQIARDTALRCSICLQVLQAFKSATENAPELRAQFPALELASSMCYWPYNGKGLSVSCMEMLATLGFDAALPITAYAKNGTWVYQQPGPGTEAPIGMRHMGSYTLLDNCSHNPALTDWMLQHNVPLDRTDTSNPLSLGIMNISRQSNPAQGTEHFARKVLAEAERREKGSALKILKGQLHNNHTPYQVATHELLAAVESGHGRALSIAAQCMADMAAYGQDLTEETCVAVDGTEFTGTPLRILKALLESTTSGSEIQLIAKAAAQLGMSGAAAVEDMYDECPLWKNAALMYLQPEKFSVRASTPFTKREPDVAFLAACGALPDLYEPVLWPSYTAFLEAIEQRAMPSLNDQQKALAYAQFRECAQNHRALPPDTAMTHLGQLATGKPAITRGSE